MSSSRPDQLASLVQALRTKADPARAKTSAWFFKTGPGQYGAGDRFLGITVPDQRQIIKEYFDLELSDLTELLKSEWHEERLSALLILVVQFKRADEPAQKQIFDFYLQNTDQINNWDLVDSSAPYIGRYLLRRDWAILSKLAHSKNVWERRIAIIMTYAFIMEGESTSTFVIADILLHDEHDLIQKAVGWMLREVGKRVDRTALEDYLQTRYRTMPRTMLRYAIERFEPTQRQAYLKGMIS